MVGYGQFCPVAKACEVLTERWTPLVLRELLCGSHSFSALHRGVPLMSRTLLAQRLRELEDAGVVRTVPKRNRRGREYYLTQAGEELKPIVESLGEWGQRWARFQLHPEDLDAALLMWDIHRRLELGRLPQERVVARFDFRGLPRGRSAAKTFWLILERSGADICIKDPGFNVDLVVSADLAALTKVWMGDVGFAETVRAGRISLDGPRDLVRAFPSWLSLSGFAGVPRPQGAPLRAVR